jgi:phage terminase small subunit
MSRRRSEAEKRLAGTFRRDRDRSPVEPPGTEPEMPGSLPDDARLVWRSLAPDLLEAGLLTSVDGSTFGLLCRLIAHVDDCYATGELPSRDVMSHFRALAKSYGLDPDSRHRLALQPPAPKPMDENPFNKF